MLIGNIEWCLRTTIAIGRQAVLCPKRSADLATGVASSRLLGFLLVCHAATAVADHLVWNAVADFRTSGNSADDTWQYLYSSATSPNQNQTLFSTYGAVRPGPATGWNSGYGNHFVGIEPTTSPPQLVVHPYRNTLTAGIGWKSTVRGLVGVEFSVRDLNAGGGNGVSYWLFHGGASNALASGVLNNGGYSELISVPDVSIDNGEMLFLFVGANAEDSYDSTGLQFEITHAPPITIVLREETRTQGDSGYPLLAGDLPVIKSGVGTLVLNAANTFSSSLSVNEGTALASNPQALGTATLNVASGATFTIAPEVGSLNGLWIEKLGTIAGKLDVGVGRFTLGPSGGSVDTVKSLLNGGRDSEGRWTGTSGITSTAAAADLQNGIVRSVGWKINPDDSITIAYAAPGDTNLDGEVNVFDLVNVNGSGTYGKGNASNWSQGDFDYNGVTNIFDMVQTNGAGVYGRGNYLPATPPSVNAVPEPASLLLAFTGLAGSYYMLRRRGA